MVSGQLDSGAKLLTLALDLLKNPARLYREAADESRRLLNLTFYERLWIDDHGVAREVLNPPFEELHEARRVYHRAKSGNGQVKIATDDSVGHANSASRTKIGLLPDLLLVRDSSRAVMVELRGLEPLTPCLPSKCSTN